MALVFAKKRLAAGKTSKKVSRERQTTAPARLKKFVSFARFRSLLCGNGRIDRLKKLTKLCP